MRRYLNNTLYMSLLLKKLVTGDKTGDWERHLMTIEKLIPIFERLDSINYLRYTSFYLELMPNLPEQFSEIYEQFLGGTFVVKTKPETFKSVASEMKLEKTIQQ